MADLCGVPKPVIRTIIYLPSSPKFWNGKTRNYSTAGLMATPYHWYISKAIHTPRGGVLSSVDLLAGGQLDR